MTCHSCGVPCRKYGVRNGLQRYQCRECKALFTEPHTRPLGAMTIPVDRGLLAVRMLVEGNSIRSTERMTDLHRDTILKLLVVMGEKCERIMGRLIVNIPCTDAVQVGNHHDTK